MKSISWIKSVCFEIALFRLRCGFTSTTRPSRKSGRVGSRWWRSAEEADISRYFCCTQLLVERRWIRRTRRKLWRLSRTEMDWKHRRRITFDDRSRRVRKNHRSIVLPDVPSHRIPTVLLILTRNAGSTVTIRIWRTFRTTSLEIR